MTANQKNKVFILILLAAVLFYVFSGSSIGISLDFGEKALTISALDYDWTLPYDQIKALELADLSETGAMIEGSEKRTLCCGTWENDIWGQYVLCVNPKIDRCIVITMTGGERYVLNYESTESTEELSKLIVDLLQSKNN